MSEDKKLIVVRVAAGAPPEEAEKVGEVDTFWLGYGAYPGPDNLEAQSSMAITEHIRATEPPLPEEAELPPRSYDMSSHPGRVVMRTWLCMDSELPLDDILVADRFDGTVKLRFVPPSGTATYLLLLVER